jgi:hypothetical protein
MSSEKLLTPTIMSNTWEFSNFVAVQWVPHCFVFGVPGFIYRPRGRISCKVYHHFIKKAEAVPELTPPTPLPASFPDHNHKYRLVGVKFTIARQAKEGVGLQLIYSESSMTGTDTNNQIHLRAF